MSANSICRRWKIRFTSRSNGYVRDQLDLRDSAALHAHEVEQPPCPSSEYLLVQPSVSTVHDFAELVESNAYELQQSTLLRPTKST